MNNINDIINNLQNENIKKICTEEYIYEKLGLNSEMLNEQPIHLSDFFGTGLKLWQYPNQFSKLLEFLSKIKCRSYLEIGCRWGGTFAVISEILIKNNKNIDLYACDIIEKSPILNLYSNIRKFEYIKGYSTSIDLMNYFSKLNIECVFIDGDHSYNGCKKDLSIFINNIETKYIILHDIFSSVCPGVVQVWNEFKNDSRFNFEEYIEQYDDTPDKNNFLGIGVAIRK